MKKFILYTLAALAVVLVIGLLFREPLKERLYADVTANMMVEEDTDSFDPGIAVGERFPLLNGRYGDEPVSDIQAFAGPRGTLFMASRSFAWCPYCMRQMKELSEYAAAFEAAGIGLVVMTYDPPEVHRDFSEKHGITVPMVSDVEAQSFRTLGILNEDYNPGDMAYGIPHPGTYIIDPDGVIVGKLFLEAYSSRVNAEAALAFAKSLLAPMNSGQQLSN